MPYCNRRHRGFTLIELLVVIAIIAVLAAIIFPTFSRVKRNARKATCLANLHQLHLAMKSYQADSDGFLPSWCISHPDPNNSPESEGLPKNEPDDAIVTWDVCLLDYAESDSLLVCKSNPVAGNSSGGDPGAEAHNARAYAMPRYTQWDFDPDPLTMRLAGVEIARIPNPYTTVLLFEKGANRPGTWGDAMGENAWQSHDSRDQLGQYRDDMFHFDGKNFLFVDGHAEWFEGGPDPAWDKENDTITIPDRPEYPSDVNPENPFKWDSGRSGSNNCGPGVMEIAWPSYRNGQWRGGDWPPAAGTWPPDPDEWP